MGNDVSVETFDKYDYLTESEYDVVNTTTGVNETEENNNTLVFHVEGYSTFHIIIYSILLTFMMIVVVIGNMLVIIAIATEKTLKNIQNWFIASLAVADFFVSSFFLNDRLLYSYILNKYRKSQTMGKKDTN